jgi:hypothetical protein
MQDGFTFQDVQIVEYFANGPMNLVTIALLLSL